MNQEINLNEKLQKELRQKELLFVFPLFIAFFVITTFLNHPVVRITVALAFVILYGRKRLELKKQGLQGHKRLQYATVWNNGVPALYFEANKENTTLFGMVLYDNQYVYTYYLYKPDDVHVSNYKLRDVIQYVGAKHSKAWNDKAFVGIGISPIMLDVLQTSPTIRDIVKDKKAHNDKK